MQTYQQLACWRLIKAYDRQPIACCEGLKQSKTAVTRQQVFNYRSLYYRSHESTQSIVYLDYQVRQFELAHVLLGTLGNAGVFEIGTLTYCRV